MRKPLVAGNWKMNGRREMATELAASLVDGVPAGVEVLVCPPFPYLSPVADVLRGSDVALGAQNLASQEDGAYTGEVSGEMLADLGVAHVLVGHSERRSLFAESDRLVAEKFVRARQAGLTPVLCVGETLAQRESGETEAVVAGQLDAVLDVAQLGQAIIAYEPVWAIGTGQTASPEQAQAVHAFIRQRVAEKQPSVATSLRILYGGSVNADNAASLFRQADIDGGLVGGASLDADSFLAICQAATAQ